MTLQTLHHIEESRRSRYALNDQLPVPREQVLDIVNHAILHTPSAFNSQSTRLVVLFGEEHHQFWEMITAALRKIVNDDDKFQSTADKMAGFKAGAGTILFFEDEKVVKELQAKYSSYADSFPVWAEHTNAMHQYALWNALITVDIGANLQHYNNIIDEKIKQHWQLDSDWRLIAQMVFGGNTAPVDDKTFEPVEHRVKVFG